jgi:hypothetical protein
MAYSKDRDLLALEPKVFAEAAVPGQEKLRVNDGTVEGTELSSTTADFEAADVQAGNVVLVSGVAHEVVERVDEQTLTVSLVRGQENAEAIPGVQGSDLQVICQTFEPQAEAARRMLVRMLNLQGAAVEPAEEAIVVNVEAIRELETLGALKLIYRQAMETTSDNTGILEKARHYENEFDRACRETEVSLDVDGDGIADRVVSLGAPRLVLP